MLGRPPSSRPRSDLSGRLAALEADLQRVTAERAHDADQIGEMLVRVASAERSRAAAESRAATAEQQAAALRAEVARLEARCAQLEAEAWEVHESRRNPTAIRPDSVHEAVSRLGAIVDELERREEIAAGLRARTLEQVRQTLAEMENPASPPVTPTPVIEIQPVRPRMKEPEPFPTE